MAFGKKQIIQMQYFFINTFVIINVCFYRDVLTNEDVISFCRERIAAGEYPEQICEALMNRCLAPDCQMGGLGGDNMTVILVCLLHGKTYEELSARCAEKLLENESKETELSRQSSESEPDLK